MLFYGLDCSLLILSWWRVHITFLWVICFSTDFFLLDLIFHKKVVDFRIVIFCTFSLLLLFGSFLILCINNRLNFDIIFTNQTEINMFWCWSNSLSLGSTFSVIFLFWYVILFLSWHWLIVVTTSTVFLFLLTKWVDMLIVRWCDAVHDILRFLLFDI